MVRVGARRAAEWSALVVVILVLMGVFGRQIQLVQGQAEAAAIKSTLGALRTAFVLNHLKQQVRPTGESVASGQRNPFLLLEQVPANYAGERGPQSPGEPSPGQWTFDAFCPCIAYTPVHSQWLEKPQAAQALWFRISGVSAPLQITATERYVWQGEALE